MDKKVVVLTHYYLTLRLKNTCCVFSRENEYFKLFVFTDENQKEIQVGRAFREGYKNLKAIKRIRNGVEFGLSKTFVNLILDHSFEKNRGDGTSLTHRHQQKNYCMDKSIELFEREDIFSSNLKFFRLFLIILACILIVALFILIIEVSITLDQ